GQEAVLVAVEVDFLQHPALHRPGAAAQVVEPLPRHRGEETVEEIAPPRLESAAGARPAPPDREVGNTERPHELADLAATHLLVGRQRDDDSSPRPLESSDERRRFAELAGEADHRDTLAR